MSRSLRMRLPELFNNGIDWKNIAIHFFHCHISIFFAFDALFWGQNLQFVPYLAMFALLFLWAGIDSRRPGGSNWGILWRPTSLHRQIPTCLSQFCWFFGFHLLVVINPHRRLRADCEILETLRKKKNNKIIEIKKNQLLLHFSSFMISLLNK